jgi:Pectinacetylesterase
MPLGRQHRRSRRRLVGALPLLAAAGMAACTDDDAADVKTVAPTTSEPGGEADAEAAGWQQVVPGGDCQCSDGSQFSFSVREVNPDKVVLFLEEGGVCFSAETCAPDNDLYNTTITEGPDSEGIFDFADDRNPFADYSVVYVPYCSGDAFIGNATTEYEPGVTIHHNGYANGSAALDHLAATFPDATDVVVMGESAGSVATPLYAGLVSDRLPDATITVLANGSGSYPDLPRANEIIAAWGFGSVVPDWPRTPASPPRHGASRDCSSRADATTPTSCSPASTTPTTSAKRCGTRVPASPSTIFCR